MRKTHYTEWQIEAILADATGDSPVSVVCRRYGISRATIYRWREKRRERQLVEENTRLKLLLADALLRNALLEDCADKPPNRRSVVLGRQSANL